MESWDSTLRREMKVGVVVGGWGEEEEEGWGEKWEIVLGGRN